MPDPQAAYEWLNLFEKCHLTEATHFWVDQIKAAIQKGVADKQSRDQVAGLIKRLLAFRNTCTDECDQAETSVMCALALYQLGNYPEAVTCLEEAVHYYGNKWHQLAVVWWMMGCIQWEMVSGHDQACSSWSLSLELFEKLFHLCMAPEQIKWYTARIQQIEQELKDQIGQECNKPGGNKPLDTITAVTLLQLFRVVEEIPAGGFGAVGYSNFTIGEVEVNQVLINNRPHRVYNLHGLRKVVNLTDKHCVVIKVRGDSMNMPSGKTSVAINDGDYVLLAEQGNAQHEDIVVVEIQGDPESSATLKRYEIKQGKAVLSPESSNPVYQPRDFTPDMCIRAVALAVFKPEK